MFMSRSIVSCVAAVCFVASSAFADPQPRMKEALEALRAAKVALEAATPNKGGHREKAIEHTQIAIDQVVKGIEVADR
jgi:hypothetical protein